MLPFDKKYSEELDSRLIAVSCDGAVYALYMLLSLHDRLIFNVALRMLGDFQKTNAFTQEILLKAIVNLQTISQTNSFRQWLYSRVASDLTADCFRRSTTDITLSVSFGESASSNTGSWRRYKCNTFGDQPGYINDACLNKALLLLPPEQRMTFILNGIFEIPVDQTSTIMQCALEIVKDRLRLAQSAIRSFIDDQYSQLQSEWFQITGKRTYSDIDANISLVSNQEERISDFLGKTIKDSTKTIECLFELYQTQTYFKTSIGGEIIQLFLFRPETEDELNNSQNQ